MRIANLYDLYDFENENNIYDDEKLAFMLEDDAIDEIEAGFMQGYLAA